ncbi:hypothetical protein HY643_01275 [Candidatus Woesearchaeota archaeon]|nr:hypothetical protein [Candidatus Woesearchaeota archaeon]
MKKKNVVVILGDPRLPDPVKKDGKFNPEDLETINILKWALGMFNNYEFTYLDNHVTLLKDLEGLSRKRKSGKIFVDYVLNFCDEGFRNNPLREKDIPKYLEKYGLPYTGAGPGCLSLCYDKAAVKKIASKQEIPVASGISVTGNLAAASKFNFPLFVKPNYGDGSFAINNNSVVNNYSGLLKQVEWVKEKLAQAKHKEVVLVEEYLPGYELTVAIIGNHPKIEARIIQEDFDVLTEGQKIIGYDTKWDPHSEGWKKLISINPKIAKSLQQAIINYSVRLFKILECRDYARFDWRLDKEGKPKLIDVNPNCGWCHDSHLVKAFSLESKESLERNYAAILEKILHAAEKRIGSDSNPVEVARSVKIFLQQHQKQKI